MVTNQKPTGRAASMPAGLLTGGLVSLFATILTAAVLAKLLDMEILEWENIGYGIMALLLLSAMLGAFVSCSRIKHQRLLVSALSGVLYFGILMAITALFFGGQYEAVGITAVLVLGGSIAVGLLGIREGKGRTRKKTTRRPR